MTVVSNRYHCMATVNPFADVSCKARSAILKIQYFLPNDDPLST